MNKEPYIRIYIVILYFTAAILACSVIIPLLYWVFTGRDMLLTEIPAYITKLQKKYEL